MTTDNCVLRKDYEGDSLYDWERDVYEAIKEIDASTDEYGFFDGVVRITIEYFPNKEI